MRWRIIVRDDFVHQSTSNPCPAKCRKSTVVRKNMRSPLAMVVAKRALVFRFQFKLTAHMLQYIKSWLKGMEDMFFNFGQCMDMLLNCHYRINYLGNWINLLIDLQILLQILSMHEQWNGFQGDDSSKASPKTPVFTMRRRSMIQSSDEAEVFMWGSILGAMAPDFRIDGCFRSRHCKIRDCSGEVAAEISRKKANTTLLLSDDVFSLIIRPGCECDLIMAFVVIMDRICRKPFAPILCSWLPENLPINDCFSIDDPIFGWYTL